MPMKAKFKVTALERNWILYDVANSAFTMREVMFTVIFANSTYTVFEVVIT